MLVSVVIPCYNVEDYIQDALAVTWAQTYRPIEVIGVNDGSTDATLSLLENWRATHQDIPMKVLDGPNRGAATARNIGLEAAEGEWIQFLDADDLLSPDKIADQVAQIERHAAPSGLVVAPYMKRRVDGEEMLVEPFSEDVWIGLSHTQLGITSANLFRKDAVQKVGGWNAKLKSSQEYDLMFRMLQEQDHVLFSTKPQATLRVRPGGSITQTNRAANWKRYIQLRVEILQYLDETNSLTHTREQAIGRSLLNALRCLYPYDPKGAIEIHRKVMPSGIQPAGKLYGWLYKLLGFARTEHLTQLISSGR